MEPARARELWQRFERLHAVTYFSPECVDAFKAIGLRGFWMAYFAGRSAPMGPSAARSSRRPSTNFEPSMVARAVPDAWSFASPDSVIEARRRAAASVLPSTCPSVESLAPSMVAPLTEVLEAARGEGRPLFSANRALGLPVDPLEALWQLATSLREHRGDGHVALLCAHELAGVEAIALFARCGSIDDEVFRATRGWSEDQWHEALGGLESRGLLENGSPTSAAHELRSVIEQSTDRLAAQPYGVLGAEQLGQLGAALGTLADELERASLIPYPNPVGLPRPSG